MLQAYKWFRLAAGQGHAAAKQDVAELAALLSPSELDAADILYREFYEMPSAEQDEARP
jgi:TPR repeat protein